MLYLSLLLQLLWSLVAHLTTDDDIGDDPFDIAGFIADLDAQVDAGDDEASGADEEAVAGEDED